MRVVAVVCGGCFAPINQRQTVNACTVPFFNGNLLGNFYCSTMKAVDIHHRVLQSRYPRGNSQTYLEHVHQGRVAHEDVVMMIL